MSDTPTREKRTKLIGHHHDARYLLDKLSKKMKKNPNDVAAEVEDCADYQKYQRESKSKYYSELITMFLGDVADNVDVVSEIDSDSFEDEYKKLCSILRNTMCEALGTKGFSIYKSGQ